MKLKKMEDKIFFKPGDVVKLKQDLPNSPKMIIHRIERTIIRKDGNDFLKGVRCRWFTENGFLQEAIFSTKDLVLID